MGILNHTKWFKHTKEGKVKVGVFKTIIHCMPDIILSAHITKVSITDIAKIFIVQAMVFPVVMYRCENWTIKKAEPPKNCGAGEDS